MCHLEWTLVEYRYAMGSTMKLLHYPQALVAHKPVEKPFFHSSVVCSSRITILKFNNGLEDDYALENWVGAGYTLVRLNSELLLQRSIYRTEQGIK